jgi:catechol 2,3-dioxygenase-like lactoylglutathione lyase family enzyme
MRVEQVLETAVYADDVAAAEAFYASVLGLEVIGRGAGRHVFFRCGPGVFLVFDPSATLQGGELPPHGARGPGHVAFVLEPTETDAWRDRLRAAGVAIELNYVWPNGGRSLYFRDPAGNLVELATRRVWTADAKNVTEPTSD